MIDEYDLPVNDCIIRSYFKEVVEVMNTIFFSSLKNNLKNCQQQILTGILSLPSCELSHGLNHMNVCTLLNNKFSKFFGFTENEVDELLDYIKKKDLKQV